MVLSTLRNDKNYRSKYGFKVLWDMENLWFETLYDVSTLHDKIEAALQTFNSNYYIYGKIVACGVEKALNRAQIRQLRATNQFELMLDVNVKCNCSVCNRPFDNDPNRQPVNQFARHTDLADGRLIKEMFLHAIGELPKDSNVLIITADSDFTTAIQNLVNARNGTNKCSVMGCINHDATNALCKAGKATWFWDKLIVGGRSMTKRQSFGRTWRYETDAGFLAN